MYTIFLQKIKHLLTIRQGAAELARVFKLLAMSVTLVFLVFSTNSGRLHMQTLIQLNLLFIHLLSKSSITDK